MPSTTNSHALPETVRLGMFMATAQGLDEMPEELKSGARYETGHEIGHGGMGVVMSAQQPAIRRQVAMKVMLGSDDENSRLRFIEEAQITGQLQHPNIVPVHDLALDEQGRPFYTMKLVQGITLQRVIEGLANREPAIVAAYPLAALLTIYQKVCDAIAFAHSRGVIHRDLKPANLMIGDYGEVLVMDWGLARVLGAKERDVPTAVTSARRDLSYCYGTIEGVLLGTPQYMSPEQSRGETATLDARSDIFALGAILHQMLTLQPAFDGPDSETILDHIRSGKTVPPHEVAQVKTLPHCPNGLVPQSLSAVVMKALQVKRERRYPNVEALQKDIAAYQGGFATSAEEAGWWRQFTLLVRRHRAVSIAVVSAATVDAAAATLPHKPDHAPRVRAQRKPRNRRRHRRRRQQR
jgi:serine/threonine protein kinase